MQAVPQQLVPNRVGEQSRVVKVPQIKEDISEERISERTLIADVPVPAIWGTFLQERFSGRMHEQTVDLPGDQARRDPADTIHRHGCRYACGDATAGPSGSDGAEDCGSPAGAIRRDSCGCACDHASDHAGTPGDQSR